MKAKSIEALVKDTLLLILGTIWIGAFIVTGLIFTTMLIPKVDTMIAGRSGIEAWLLGFIPLYVMLNILFIGGYLYHKLANYLTPRFFEPIKGKIEIQKEGGTKKWYQRLLS